MTRVMPGDRKKFAARHSNELANFLDGTSALEYLFNDGTTVAQWPRTRPA